MESKEYLPQLRLTDLEVYVDEELIDYITVLLINKKSAKQMIDDLNLFLNEHSDAFVKWLFKTCEKLQSAKYDEKEKMIDNITKGKTREKKADEVVSKLDKDERKIQASLKRKEEDDYNRSKALKSEKVYEKKEKSKLTSTTAATTTKRPYSSPSPQSLHPSSIHHEKDHREARHYPVVRGTTNSNEDSINRNHHHHQTSHESYGGNRKRRTSRKSPISVAYNSHDGKSDYYHDQRSGGNNRSQTPPQHRPERKVAVQKKDEYARESYSSDDVQHTTSKQQQEGATRDTGKQRHIVVEQTKISESMRDEKDTELSAKSLRDAEPVLIGERIDKIVSEDVLINDHVLKSAIVKIASNKDKNSPHPPNELFLKALQSLDLRYKLKKEGSVIGPSKLPLTLEEVKRYRSTKSIDNTELHQMLAEKIDMHFIGTKKSLEMSRMLAEEDPYSPVRVREPDPSKAALTPPPPQYHPTELGETKPNNLNRAEYAQTDEVDEENVVLKPQTTARTLQQPLIPGAQKNSVKTGAATLTRRQPLLGETPQPIPTRDTRFIVTLNDKPFVRNFVGKKMLFSPSSRDRVSSSSANNEEYYTWDDTPPITQSSIVYDGIQVDVAEGEVESFSQATHADQGTVASNSSMVTLSNQALSAGPNPIHINIHPQLFNMRDPVTKPPGNTPFVPTRKTNIYERLGGANVINDESDDIIMGDMDEEGIGEMDTSIPIEGHINERCKFWPACKNGDTCLFHHPILPCKNFPHCTFGDKCLFIHPNCKFDAHCTKKDCPFTHASVRRDLNAKSAPIISPSFALNSGAVGGSNQFSYISGVASSKVKPCKFGPTCQNPACPFMHPPECKFGNMCSRSGCMFTHSVKTYGAANLQNKSRGPALKNKWVNPNLILGQTIPHNPNNNNNHHPSNDIISTA